MRIITRNSNNSLLFLNRIEYPVIRMSFEKSRTFFA